jgi:Ca-activated chloride channel family protein
VTLGVVVDESGSMAPKRTGVLSAAETMIAEGNPHDAIFVLNFNEQVRRGLPPSTLFSGNISQLRLALNRGMPQGRTALYDAVIEGLNQLNQGKHERKALVVISDGGDNASTHKRADMLDQLERSGATVFAIGIYTEGDPEIDPGVLRQIAHATGGEALFPQDATGMTAACRRIAKEIRTRYVIGYRPPDGSVGGLRHIRVRVSDPEKPGLKVLARGSYRFGATTNGENVKGSPTL